MPRLLSAETGPSRHRSAQNSVGRGGGLHGSSEWANLLVVQANWRTPGAWDVLCSDAPTVTATTDMVGPVLATGSDARSKSSRLRGKPNIPTNLLEMHGKSGRLNGDFEHARQLSTASDWAQARSVASSSASNRAVAAPAMRMRA